MFNQEAMKEFKELLIKNFPGHIDKVILFGSQLKGGNRDYSDYDVLIIVKKAYDWKFKNKVYDKTWEIDYKYNILTDIKLISNGELQTVKGKQPFILDALENGVVL